MKKKEGKNIFHKKWAEINNNDSVDNDERDFSPKMDKIEEIGKTHLFSIGDIWTEETADKPYFYKVAAIEDIAISSEVYRCYKVIEQAEGGLKNYYWFAPEIGLVKWKIGKNKGILKECSENTGSGLHGLLPEPISKSRFSLICLYQVL